jgi:stearoyl-CoA desaturase (delta-9 desaturase)
MEYSPPRQSSEIMGFKDILPINHTHIIYIAIHLIALSIIWSGFSWFGISLCLVSYFGRHLGLVAGYHRYFAHRSFKTSRLMQFFLGLHGSLCAERGPLWWGQTHRLHHRYSDTPNDIHSPYYQGFLYSHSGWFFNQKFFRTNYEQIPEFAEFPELMWLDRFHLIPLLAFAASMFYFFGWEGFAWGFCLSTVLIWHTTHTIQSLCHCFSGYRNFPTSDNSRNFWLFGVISLGDGFHNNHHYEPSSARHGFFWWEIDLAWYILKFLSWFGLVWDLKTPEKCMRNQSSNLDKVKKNDASHAEAKE